MYTIGQVSKMFGLPISTLRYYDKEGLFPDMERSNGIRRFGQRELEALRVELLGKKGVVSKPAVHERVLRDIAALAPECGWRVRASTGMVPRR